MFLVANPFFSILSLAGHNYQCISNGKKEVGANSVFSVCYQLRTYKLQALLKYILLLLPPK